MRTLLLLGLLLAAAAGPARAQVANTAEIDAYLRGARPPPAMRAHRPPPTEPAAADSAGGTAPGKTECGSDKAAPRPPSSSWPDRARAAGQLAWEIYRIRQQFTRGWP